MNNTIIGSVNQLYKKLDKKVISLIEKDKEEINLDSHFKDSTSNTYSVDNQHVFIKNAKTELPDSLIREVESLDYEHKMGFLSEINHVWISTGTTLFLWNHVDKTDIFRYECSEAIGNVETIEIKNKTQLLVSTQKFLYLHGITYNDKEKLKILSNINCKAEGTIFSNFLVTNNNRSFMQGSDGHVYELNVSIIDNSNQPNACHTICHTASPILKFLPYFFKSAPEVAIKSMTMDIEKDLLFLLLTDSSIHSVNIQGSQYLPLQRTYSTNLESIHYIPSNESNSINLMAVSSKGDRLYFSSKDKSIELIHTRSAPPLPGSLLFNSLTKESCELSFYNFGIFASVLAKSEKKYLVFSSANSFEESGSRILLEDVHHELLDGKVWSINEISSKEALKSHYFAETLISPKIPTREFCTLSESGITHYSKQRPVDYLAEVISKNEPKGTLAFLKRYGIVETSALAFLLACSEKGSANVSEFIRNAHFKEEGLLLYVARIVESIWNVDILQETISKDDFKAVQKRLDTLYTLIVQENIKIEKNYLDFILRIIEGIVFVCCIHSIEWDQTRASLSPTSNGCKFGELVTTEEGALLTRDITLSAIKYSKLSNATNDYNFITNFLDSECKHLLGEKNIPYYRGMESLQAARNEPGNEKALLLSLDHFYCLTKLIELGTLKVLARDYSSLGYYIGGIRLAYAKYQLHELPESSIYEIIFTCIQDALNSQKGSQHAKSTIEEALSLTNEQIYHYKIYQWLMDNDNKSLLVTIDTPLLETYIKTQLPLSESLACLRHYHYHRKEFYLAILDLLELATKVEDISLEVRVGCLQKANEYLQLAKDDIPESEKKDLLLMHEEAKIQLNIYKTLLKSNDEKIKLDAHKLGLSLKPAKILYDEFAYTHSLYEDALQLMDLMDLHDWKYVKEAWTHIINKYQDEGELKSKILELAKRFYPSISSFPVYIIYKILEEHRPKYSKDFAKDTLIEAGVPEEVLLDAKESSNDQ